MIHKPFVCVLCFVLIVSLVSLPYINAVTPTYTDKKIGPWVGNWEKTVAPGTWVLNVFDRKPFYSTALIQTGVLNLNEGVDWAKNVGVEASKLNRPEIEIIVEYAFGRAIYDEASWTAFTSHVNSLKAGQPAIKYIGIEAEWACPSECPQATKSLPLQMKDWMDRVATIVEPAGFVPLHYQVQGSWYSTSVNYTGYRIIPTITFPTWGDGGWTAGWFQPNSEWVGMQPGVATNVPTDPSGTQYQKWLANKGGEWAGYYWTQELVNYVIDKSHEYSPGNRHFTLFAGPMVDPSAGTGRDGAYYWSEGFRDWIWQRQNLYWNEFNWVKKSGEIPIPPVSGTQKSYLDFEFHNASQLAIPSSIVTWKLLNGTQEVQYSPLAYTLSTGTYTLKTFYAGYLMKVNTISTLNATVVVRLSLFQHKMGSGGLIAFNQSLSSFVISEQSQYTLSFRADSSATSHLIVIRSPNAPSYVTRDGTTFNNWFFDESQNVTIIESPTLGSWTVAFAPPDQQPQPPWRFFPWSFADLPIYMLLTIGFVLGITAFVTIYAAKRRGLERNTHWRSNRPDF